MNTMVTTISAPPQKEDISIDSNSVELKARAFESLIELKLNNKRDIGQILITLAQQTAKIPSSREQQFDEYVKASRLLKE